VTEAERLTEVFFDVQRGLPRQGIGSDEDTLRALALCAGLPAQPDILDVGCGPGLQTVTLARATGGQVTAVDLHEEFLDQLRGHASSDSVADRIAIMRGDMRDLPFGPASFDLVWSEGAAYIMGTFEALVDWRRFLRSGGYVAFSELVWTTPDRPAEVVELYARGYAGMTDVAGNRARIRDAGYELVGHFRLPEAAWWDEYFGPLEAKLPALFKKYAGDDAALAIVDETRREIDLRRRYPESFGYEFFVARAG
jgi:ubiquinone/menaquinone biosynthesis C-methylase UbiE